MTYEFRNRDLSLSLVNYKRLHEKRAKEMGVYEKFMAAPTLTRARLIVFPK